MLRDCMLPSEKRMCHCCKHARKLSRQARASATQRSPVEPVQAQHWGGVAVWVPNRRSKNDPSARCAYPRDLRTKLQQASDHQHPPRASPTHVPPAPVFPPSAGSRREPLFQLRHFPAGFSTSKNFISSFNANIDLSPL